MARQEDPELASYGADLSLEVRCRECGSEVDIPCNPFPHHSRILRGILNKIKQLDQKSQGEKWHV